MCQSTSTQTSRQIWLRMLTIWRKRWPRSKDKPAHASADTKPLVMSTRAAPVSNAHARSARLISQRSSAAISVALSQPSARRMSVRRLMTFTSRTDPAEGLVAQLIIRFSMHSECKKSTWKGCIRVTPSSWWCLSFLSALTPLIQRLGLSTRTKKKSITLALKCTRRLLNAARDKKRKRRREAKVASGASMELRNAAHHKNRMALNPLVC